MKLDAELMFECLIYLNIYYYPVLATCISIMAGAKWQSVVDTPDIGRDAAVAFTILFAEIFKIILYEKFKEVRRDMVTGLAVFLTIVTLCGNMYTFFLQSPVMRLEYILCTMTTMLAMTQITFGTLQIMPCFKKVQYY